MVENPSWERFMVWNQAIADACFPVLEIPERVYLDLDDDVANDVAEILGIGPESFQQSLGVVVREVLELRLSKFEVFEEVLRRVDRWSASGATTPPPVLPILAALSLAAENMSSEDGMRESNYYQRLIEILSVRPSRKIVLTEGYRDAASQMWNALNKWLQRLNHSRGIPTAAPVSKHQRHVGWALSQALVRNADRERMRRFFSEAALPAGAELRLDELRFLFDSWLARSPSSASTLHRLWQSEELREKVLEVLADELVAWDGQDSRLDRGNRSAESQNCKLVLSYRSFPRKEISITALAYLERSGEPRAAVLTAGEKSIAVELEPEVPGALRFGLGIMNTDLLGANLGLTDHLTGESVDRRPKRLVVFRQDVKSSLWLETDGVLPGEELRLMVRNDVLGDLTGLLTAVGVENFSQVDKSVQGHPEGWTLLIGVQVRRSLMQLVPANRREFQQLEPLVQSQVQLYGGLQIPGRRLTWHSSMLPEVRIVQQDAPGFTVRLLDMSEGSPCVLEEWHDRNSGEITVDLANGERLAPGKYRIVAEHLESGQTFERVFSVVNSFEGNPVIPRQAAAPRLIHPLVALGVDADTVERASGAPQTARLDPAGLLVRPWWDKKLRPKTGGGQALSLPTVEPDSCVFTGAHHWEIPLATDSRGKPLAQPAPSQCRHCGLRQTHENKHWRLRKASKQKLRSTSSGSTASASHRPALIPPVDSFERSIPWDSIADALVVMGSGTWASLQTLIRQVDESGPAVFHIIHSLEAIGLIEVLRSPETLEPVRWRTIDPFVLKFEDGIAELRGAWSLTMRASFERALGQRPDIAAPSAQNAMDSGPELWSFDVSQAEWDLPELRWEELAENLPPISSIIAALPRRPLLRSVPANYFHVPSASWIDSPGVQLPGAYRFRGRGMRDVLCTEDDLADGLMSMSQVRFSKHAAAYLYGRRPLMAYDTRSEELTVPLGADLPGLYNRAAVLASGQLPHRAQGNTVYSDIPADLAELLNQKLSN